MKIASLILLLLSISFLTRAQTDPGRYIEGLQKDYNIPMKDGHIEDILFSYPHHLTVLINHTATMDKLVKIKESLKRYGVHLTYRDLRFDSTGKLESAGIDVGDRAVPFLRRVSGNNLTDTTRFGVSVGFTDQSYFGPFAVGYLYN